MADPLTHDARVRLRFAIAAVLTVLVMAALIGFVFNRVLDPPWSFLSIPIGWALGWWAGKHVVTPILFGRQQQQGEDQ